MILPVFFCFLPFYLFTFKKSSGGPAMESLGTGTERRKASLQPPFPAIPSLVPHLKPSFYLFNLFTLLLLKAFFSPPGAQDKG